MIDADDLIGDHRSIRLSIEILPLNHCLELPIRSFFILYLSLNPLSLSMIF